MVRYDTACLGFSSWMLAKGIDCRIYSFVLRLQRLSDVTTDLQLAMKSMEERLETLERMLTPPEKTQRSWSFR